MMNGNGIHHHDDHHIEKESMNGTTATIKTSKSINGNVNHHEEQQKEIPNINNGSGSSIKKDEHLTYSSSPSTKAEQPLQQQHLNLRRRGSSVMGITLRIIVLDLPLFLICILYCTILYIDWISTNYLVPQSILQQFHTLPQDVTYYHRICTVADQTAHNSTELIVDIGPTNDSTTTTTKIQKAVHKMLVHGATIIPNLISVETATQLREYILQENLKEDHLIYVIENKHRWSFPIQVDQHPIISTALQEILHQPNLQEYIEAVMGTDPAVIEFTAITQAYGAADQFWHQDVVPSTSAAKFGRKFVPSYSLFIPLQNVTTGMGATGICPGTHMCSESDFCAQTGFQVSYNGDVNPQNHIWPLGYGAFVNQQTTHRGAAHRDPNGPHRVLFILTFAPRPQTVPPSILNYPYIHKKNDKVVETRIIGMAGSYSLHWSQWGHTLNDYKQPLKYMEQPYRTLRTLGIYNNNRHNQYHWGWDYITTSSARISNSDTGFTQSDLYEFLNKGGFCWLPKRLQGNYSDEMDQDEEISYGWIDFFNETIQKCKIFLYQVYLESIVVHVGFILVSTLLHRKTNWLQHLVKNILRLVAIHAAIIFTFWILQQQVIHSSWGRNIQSERSFHMPNHPLALAPTLPGTLPVDEDVLIVEGMKSETLSSFSDVLEVFHPGNREWNDIVSHFAPNYHRYNIELQHHIRQQVLQMIDQQSRRILLQNHQWNWATITSSELRHLFCHKSLLQTSDRLMNHLMKSFDHLFAETRYGYWRDSSIHQKHISQHVNGLRNRVLMMATPQVLKDQLQVQKQKSSFQLQLKALIPKRSLAIRSIAKNFPSDELIAKEGSASHWLNVGDIVEASYVDDPTEWYRGTLTAASAVSGLWDVLYDDGEEASSLCHSCVRPFQPYSINETIDVRVAPDFYSPCVVVAIHEVGPGKKEDLLFDVKLVNGDDRILSNVPPKDLRRKYRKGNGNSLPPIPEQTRVMAMYVDEEGSDVDYFTGRIIRYRSSGNTYDVEFDDGDIGYNIPRYKIELEMTE